MRSLDLLMCVIPYPRQKLSGWRTGPRTRKRLFCVLLQRNVLWERLSPGTAPHSCRGGSVKSELGFLLSFSSKPTCGAQYLLDKLQFRKNYVSRKFGQQLSDRCDSGCVGRNEIFTNKIPNGSVEMSDDSREKLVNRVFFLRFANVGLACASEHAFHGSPQIAGITDLELRSLAPIERNGSVLEAARIGFRARDALKQKIER